MISDDNELRSEAGTTQKNESNLGGLANPRLPPIAQTSVGPTRWLGTGLD